MVCNSSANNDSSFHSSSSTILAILDIAGLAASSMHTWIVTNQSSSMPPKKIID